MVWLGLVALTAITVSVAGLNLGAITVVVALLIATVNWAMSATTSCTLIEHKVFKVFGLYNQYCNACTNFSIYHLDKMQT
jgi:hypothetical protein